MPLSVCRASVMIEIYKKIVIFLSIVRFYIQQMLKNLLKALEKRDIILTQNILYIPAIFYCVVERGWL